MNPKGVIKNGGKSKLTNNPHIKNLNKKDNLVY